MLVFMLLAVQILSAQQDSTKLNLQRIFASGEFFPDFFRQARWMDEGTSYTILERSKSQPAALDIVQYETKKGIRSILVSADQLIPEGAETPLYVENYEYSANKEMLLLFTNSKRVWRTNTKGDYWILNLKTNKLTQLGKGLPASSLMFAKFSPNNLMVAYVSEHDVFSESIATGEITRLTFNGSEDLINGTFDWAYEEEFSARDGFRWSPDSKNIAYWQLDASKIRDFLMINNTDSIYSYTIPVEYPKVGEDPSSCRIGVVPANGVETIWMDIPGDPVQNYLPRMMWSEDSKDIMVQQLNRKQNTLTIYACNAANGKSAAIYTESDEAWVDVVDDWMWLNDGKDFTWVSEKDGWRKLYIISRDGSSERAVLKEDFDLISILDIDPKRGYVYFIASPDNATQRYLYRLKLNGKKAAERLTPADQAGTHSYQIADGGKYAFHTVSDFNSPPTPELISLPKHESIRLLASNEEALANINSLDLPETEFFQITTEDSVTMDGYIIKPTNFDATKKYPVLFHVYGEPAGQTANDSWGYFQSMWHRMLAQQGYVIISMDNRGTPAPKGREWRKSIYGKIGVINSRDQAMGAKKILEWPFIDPERVAVWGWSGGGSMTLNLLFRYPEIYKAGMSVAPVANQLLYDNIYQERYMGVPWENKEDFIEGSPVTYAKNLEGELLLMHGTGDDNVHYQNAEVLINELIKNNKVFQVMPYPNRSHGIYEGRGTTMHVYNTLTHFLNDKIEAGPKEQ